MVLDTLEDLDDTFLGNGKQVAEAAVPAVVDRLDLMLDQLDILMVEVVLVVQVSNVHSNMVQLI
tara:strand:- start:338 stop:529 length:192 start_codon:yes stop_codon:yes gene_type:complete